MIDWTPDQKHPLTNSVVLRNVWSYDLLRRVLRGRCQVCDYVLSDEAVSVREIAFTCGDPKCKCAKPAGSTIHQVCDLCYWMIRSIYNNNLLKNPNYFREIDDRERNERRDARRKGGLEGGF